MHRSSVGWLDTTLKCASTNSSNKHINLSAIGRAGQYILMQDNTNIHCFSDIEFGRIMAGAFQWPVAGAPQPGAGARAARSQGTEGGCHGPAPVPAIQQCIRSKAFHIRRKPATNTAGQSDSRHAACRCLGYAGGAHTTAVYFGAWHCPTPHSLSHHPAHWQVSQ